MVNLKLKHTDNSLQDTLRHAVLALQESKIESASLDARLLLQHVLGVSHEDLLSSLDTSLTPEQHTKYKQWVEARAARRPISHIIGKREFYGVDFKVTEDTLDPRPDSETLIEAVLEYAKNRQKPYKILDIGVGTGCLCLSLLNQLPDATAMGVDISDAALAIAKENSIALALASRVAFIASNWCENVEGSFDIIVANPPYIPSQSIEWLSPEVAKYEPRLALDGGNDGLDAYREIMKALPDLLADDGIAVFEIGQGQQDDVSALAEENGLRVQAMKKDMGGIIRCMLITK